MRSQPRLLMVGHSYHGKTGSSRFIRELLEPHFELQLLLDDSWQPGSEPLHARTIDAFEPDHVLFWQQLPARRELLRLRCRNLTWAPMHDGIHYESSQWRKLAGARLKLLSFSQHLHQHFQTLGYDSLPLRYYPPPDSAPLANFHQGLRLFFWIRHASLGWPQIKRLLGPQRPQRLLLRVAADPGEQPILPDADECREYRIELLDRWLSPEEYADLLSDCNLFVAPRLKEGIGMATLEAMSRGMAVIAADAPTMNEYLRHGDTGYLFRPEAPETIDLSQAKDVGQRARQALSDGHRTWQMQVPELIGHILKPPAIPAWHWRLRRALAS